MNLYQKKFINSSFFSLYANLDNYEFVESNKSKKLVEIDDWILIFIEGNLHEMFN